MPIHPLSSPTLGLLAAAVLSTSMPSLSFAQAPLPDWENPAVFRINKEPAHASKMPFPSARDAVQAASRIDSPWALSLNGSWQFHWAPTLEAHPADFYQIDFDAADWGSIPVPANVELHGHGTPIYSNIEYPFPKNPPSVTDTPPEDWTHFSERHPISAYRHHFQIPKSWDGRQTYIVFNGVNSAFSLFLNGQKVGYSQDSRTPAEFNLTPYLQHGENLLAVEVHRFSDGSYLEDQDFWRLSGIFRDVYLWSGTTVDLRDFEIHTSLSDDYQTGVLDLTSWTRNLGKLPAQYSLAATLIDSDSRVIAEKTLSGSVPAADETLASLHFDNLAITPWSAELPHQYTLLLSLKDAQNEPTAHFATKIGFLRSEIVNGNLLVNGKPILIKGVNRHDHDHLSGHYISEATMRAELDLMKRLNINAIRTSHYPNDPRFLELVDQYGFYIISEANIETHALGTDPKNVIANDPTWLPALTDRVSNMIETLKNHPSIIMWSLGNEAGDGSNFESMGAWVKTRDASRPLHYEGARERDYVDIFSPMYYSIEYLEAWCRKQETLSLNEQRPMIQCEYSHAMGNSCGGLDQYWKHIRSERLLQGGFIWDWRDQGILRTKAPSSESKAAVSTLDPQRFVAPDGNLRYFAYGGDFGDKPNDDNFCMNGVVQADLTPNPHATEVAYLYRSILTRGVDLSSDQPAIRIFNENFFTPLTQQPLLWSLLENGYVIQSGELTLPNLSPQAAVELSIPLAEVLKKTDAEYHLNVAYPQANDRPWADADFICARDQLPLSWTSPAIQPHTASASAQFSVETSDRALTVHGPSASAQFDPKNGQLLAYQVKGRDYLHAPLELNFWRAPIDNDRGNRMPRTCAPWREAGRNATVLSQSHTQTGATFRLLYELSLPVGQSTATLIYEFFADGALAVSLELKPAGAPLPALPSIGFQCALLPEYRDWSWFGHGPEENYSDRSTGTFLGVWNGPVDSLWFPYAEPQETANRTGVRWTTFNNEAGHGLHIHPSDGQHLEISAYPFLQSDLEGLRHPADIPLRDFVTVQIAHRQMGVGGETSWGAWPLPDHLLPANRNYSFAFVLKPQSPEKP